MDHLDRNCHSDGNNWSWYGFSRNLGHALYHSIKTTLNGLVMGSGTQKPKTREENPTFLVPEPNPNPRNGTRTQPKPDFCYLNPSIVM